VVETKKYLAKVDKREKVHRGGRARGRFVHDHKKKMNRGTGKRKNRSFQTGEN